MTDSGDGFGKSDKEKALHVKSRIIGASIWSFISSAATQISTFIIFIVLARLLGPADFGVVAFAAIFIDLSRGVMLGGIPEALIQRLEWHDDVAQTAFWINVVGSIAFVATICLVCTVLINVQAGSTLPLLVSALSATLLIDALRAVHEARLRREFRYRALATRTVMATIVGGIIGIICALGGMGVWALVINRIASSILQTLIMWSAASFRPRFYMNMTEAKILASFGAQVLSSRLLAQVNTRLPDFIIGAVAGSAALGVYRVGSRSLNFLVQTMITPIQSTALSAFSRLESPPAVARAYSRFTQICATITFPAFFGAAAIAEEFIDIFFGSQWHMSAPIMSILALGVIATTILQFFQSAMQSVGRPRSGISTEVARLASGLVFIGSLSIFGPLAAAAGDTVRKYVALPQSLKTLRQELGLQPSLLLKGLAPPLLCAIAMASLLFLLKFFALDGQSHLGRLVLLVTAGAIAYPVLMLCFGRGFLQDMLESIEQAFPPSLGRLMRLAVGSHRKA